MFSSEADASCDTDGRKQERAYQLRDQLPPDQPVVRHIWQPYDWAGPCERIILAQISSTVEVLNAK